MLIDLCLWEKRVYSGGLVNLFNCPNHMGVMQGDIFMCLASPCWWWTWSYPRKQPRIMILKIMGLCYHMKPGETLVIGGLFGTIIHNAKTHDLSIIKYPRLNSRCLRYSVCSWWIFYQKTTILAKKNLKG